MKIEEILKTLEDGGNGYAVKINGKTVFSVMDGEPEDNNLSRNFNDVYGIVDIMEMAFDAGRNGEEFTVEQVER